MTQRAGLKVFSGVDCWSEDCQEILEENHLIFV